MPDGVLAYLSSLKLHHFRYRICHGSPISGRNKPTRSGPDEFGDATATKGDDRCAATHRFGDDESVRFVPHRSDQCRRGPTDQARQFVLVQVTGISNVVGQVGGHLAGKVIRVRHRTGEHQ